MKEADVFYKKAKQLISFIEQNIITKDNIKELITYLLEISIEAYQLPKIKPGKIDFYRDIKRYEIKLSKDIEDRYYFVFDPTTEKETISNTITDDLDDITHDLEKGIVEYEEGKKNNAIFLWKETYNTHFGYHILNLLNVLHRYYNQK